MEDTSSSSSAERPTKNRDAQNKKKTSFGRACQVKNDRRSSKQASCRGSIPMAPSRDFDKQNNYRVASACEPTMLHEALIEKGSSALGYVFPLFFRRIEIDPQNQLKHFKLCSSNISSFAAQTFQALQRHRKAGTQPTCDTKWQYLLTLNKLRAILCLEAKFRHLAPQTTLAGSLIAKV
jgi:hypothetical protein